MAVHKSIDGKAVADSWTPKIVSVLIGDNLSVDLSVRNQRRAAEKVNMHLDERHYFGDITEPEILAAIGSMNVDPSITGIIVQRPVPEAISIKRMQSAIHPLKNIAGKHPASIGNIVYNELELGPCTAMAASNYYGGQGSGSKW
jgi:methylenetetrahydrofolate dehydrogenase (NADP+)/methenyltetrahydrofolate cyclohydrolase